MLNQVFLIGRLGRDPEIKEVKDSRMATFSLATTERWKTADGYETRTEWHDIVVYGALVNVVESYLAKGSLVYMDGMLRKREYQAKDGTKKTAVNVVLSGPNAKLKILADGKAKKAGKEEEPQNYDDDIPF